MNGKSKNKLYILRKKIPNTKPIFKYQLWLQIGSSVSYYHDVYQKPNSLKQE